MQGSIVSLSRSDRHGFSKQTCSSAQLVAGLGMAGDTHAGRTVQHRSRVAIDPTQPNLRQVHILPMELLEALAADGFQVAPGALGENMITSGLDLHALPQAARLRFPSGAELELTGLRNPCRQIDDFMPGLLAKVAWRDEAGALVRRAGVMTIVVAGGPVAVGDAIVLTWPSSSYRPLDRV